MQFTCEMSSLAWKQTIGSTAVAAIDTEGPRNLKRPPCRAMFSQHLFNSHTIETTLLLRAVFYSAVEPDTDAASIFHNATVISLSAPFILQYVGLCLS